MNPTQLRRVVQNLIGNAIAHRSPDRAPAVVVSSEARPDGMVAVSVSDNGVGIPPPQQDLVFEMFKQLKPGEGTGIGLAIVARVVELYGGTIEVSSDGTTGSTFTFTAPGA